MPVHQEISHLDLAREMSSEWRSNGIAASAGNRKKSR